jgi:DNA-binding response OmpR family regulator
MAVASSRRIFVVDDEPIISKSLAAILNHAGFDARAFEDGPTAVTAAEEKSPDLLITDVVMPIMTGIELGIVFRNRWPECKILLFSGQASTADLLASASQQGYDFEVLAKPIHPKDLLAKLVSLSA